MILDCSWLFFVFSIGSGNIGVFSGILPDRFHQLQSFILKGEMPIMNQRTIAMAERALMDFIKKSRRERDYFRGRLIKADNLAAPNQHMISAAVSKLEWYKVELMELEGELEMLREELGITNTDQEEESGGEEEENTEHDAR
jgi:hypothetical protein